MKVGPKTLSDSSGGNSGSLRDYYSSTLVKPKVKLYGMTYFSFKAVLFLYTGLIALLALVLAFELNWCKLIW